MRTIDADKLPEHKFARESTKSSRYMRGWNAAIDAIVNNEPTVNDCPNCEYKKNYDYLSSSSSYKELQALRKFKKDNERPRGECRTCKYYHPYCEQLTNIPRGDGYCVIARMTPEGMTTINCNDEFSCSDYQKIEGGGA